MAKKAVKKVKKVSKAKAKEEKKLQEPEVIKREEGDDLSPIEPAKLAEMIEKIKQIGSKNANGYILIGEVIDGKDEHGNVGVNVKADTFVYRVSQRVLLNTVLGSLNANPLAVISALAEVDMEKALKDK
jgi:hypothetical protein